ncbi:SH3 domain-containing protein [Actinomadura logoneensis]|uniref:SH3 domain-containing protein n=1 Tax=Actinomadura logoneensis TaxID=2293572 RepID=A0A372JFC4_9ACTN|nr:SH3 domain-containing protein [Actinomadura logoneensis]RFU38078.1 SH3 domain-containing protein [Actinomadura logoneensis]
MRIRKTAALAVPVAALSMLAPAQADASTSAPATSARTCYYNVVHIRVHGHLNVRSGPGLRYRVVARLPYNARHVPGDCRTHRADHRTWVHLTHPMGWADGHYLRAVR